MSLFPSKWLVMMMAAMAFSAPAQQTIIFSKPADMSADKANSFMPGSEHRSGDYNAPHPLFNDFTPDLPMPKPLFSANNDASVKDALNKRKNWTLLTPEQILGIQTPEEVLGLTDKSDEKKLSLEEQFLLRESRSATASATNGRAGNLFRRETDAASPFADNNQIDENNPFRQSLQRMEPGMKSFNPSLNGQDSGTGPDEKSASSWNSVFAQPDQPKPTTEQLADMDRFRALMEPSSPPEQTPAPTRFSVATVPAPDPFLQPAAVVNPAGRAIPSLDNEFSRPTGIKPLPGISTLPPTPVATKPSWQAQLPPWMRSGPQTHNSSQNY
jgi:hypothetical protein